MKLNLCTNLIKGACIHLSRLVRHRVKFARSFYYSDICESQSLRKYKRKDCNVMLLSGDKNICY